MKLPKILSRIGLVLLVLVTVLLIVRAVLNYVEGRKLSSTLADLKAQGVPLTVKELIPPCPDGQNGAGLWRAAEEFFLFEGEDTKLLNEVFQDLYRDQPVKTEAWPSVVRLIEKNRRALDLITEVAGKPCFRYGDMKVKFWERRMPNAIKMIRAVRLWGLESLHMADKGDVTVAVDRLRVGLRFAPRIAEEGTLIAFLIALADAKTCLLSMDRSLSGHKIGEESLRTVLGDLDDGQIERWKALLRNAIRGERVMFMDVNLPFSARVLQQAVGGKSWTERLYFWLIRPLLKRDLRQNLPAYAELEAKAALPYYQTRDFWKPYNDRRKDLPWYAIVSKIVIPEMESAFMKVATFDAMVLTARAGLACRIYKSRSGRYPETLEALIPDFLKKVPTDPFTGKPLVYRRDGEGFIVYSLGSNLKDDGGRSTYMITQLVMDKDDDWTWKEDR
jgi:hypothetical protein